MRLRHNQGPQGAGSLYRGEKNNKKIEADQKYFATFTAISGLFFRGHLGADWCGYFSVPFCTGLGHTLYDF